MNKNHNVQLGVAKICWVAKLVLRNENFSRNCTRSNITSSGHFESTVSDVAPDQSDKVFHIYNIIDILK